MKTYLSCASLIAALVLTLTGCQTQTAAARTSNVTDTPGTRVYSQNDLNDTGQATPGAALRKLDPDISHSGN